MMSFEEFIKQDPIEYAKKEITNSLDHIAFITYVTEDDKQIEILEEHLSSEAKRIFDEWRFLTPEKRLMRAVDKLLERRIRNGKK